GGRVPPGVHRHPARGRGGARSEGALQEGAPRRAEELHGDRLTVRTAGPARDPPEDDRARGKRSRGKGDRAAGDLGAAYASAAQVAPRAWLTAPRSTPLASSSPSTRWRR